MKGIKKHLVALLSTVLMMTSLGIAPALADDAPLGNDDFNIVVNKKLNPKDLTLDFKIKLEDKDPTTPKVVNDLSQVFKNEGKEKEKLDLVKDKTDEYEMVVSENGEVEFELNYSKEVKSAEGETEAINRDEKHSFKVNVTEIDKAKAEEPKVEEPKAEEPKVQEPAADEDVVDGLGIQGLSIVSDGTVISRDPGDTRPVNILFNGAQTNANTALYSGSIEIDLSSAPLVVDKSKVKSTNSSVKLQSYDTQSKIMKFKIEDGFSGSFSIQFPADVSVAAVPSTTSVVSAKMNGKDNTGAEFEEAAAQSGTINITGNPGSFVEADSTNFASWSYARNWNGSVYAGGVIGWFVNNFSGQELHFSDLKIVRKNHNLNFDLYDGVSPYIDDSKLQTRRYLVKNDGDETIVSYGEVSLSRFDLRQNTKVPSGTASGSYNFEYEIYNGNNLIGTINQKTTVLPDGTMLRPVHMVSPTTAGEGDRVIYRTAVGVDGSGPYPTKNLEEIILIPSEFKPIRVGGNSMDHSYETNNSGVYTQITDGEDISSISNITRIKLSRSVTISNQTDNHQYIEGILQNTTPGQSVDFEIEKVNYIDTVGVQHEYFSEGGTNPKTISVEIQSSSNNLGTTQLQVGDVDGGYPGTGYGVIPTAPTMKARFSTLLTIQNGGGPTITNPYVFMIAPEGLEVNTNISRHGIRLNTRPLDHSYVGRDVFIRNEQPELEKIPLSNGKVIYLYKLKNDELVGTRDFGELLQVQFNVDSSKLIAGKYDVEFGAGSFDSEIETVNSPKYSSKNLSQEEKDLIGTSAETYQGRTKSFEITRANGVKTNSGVKGGLDANWLNGDGVIGTSKPYSNVYFGYTLENEGTLPIDRFTIIDTLPNLGDSTITTGIGRGSNFKVNATGSIKVLINGAESDRYLISYSTSENPERFDASGNNIPGEAWTTSKPVDDTTIRAIKVEMLDKLMPTDKLYIEFEGVLPAETPRDDSMAYNSIAYRGETTSGSITNVDALELTKTGVKASKPTEKGILEGQLYYDLDKNGKNNSEAGMNGITVELYDSTDLSTALESTTTSVGNGVDGMFGFIDKPNGDYQIKIVFDNDVKAESFGTDQVEIDSSGKFGWLKKSGSKVFKVSDIFGTEEIKDINGALTLMTNISGGVIFVDKDDNIVTSNYGKDWKVELLLNDSVIKTVQTGNSGSFAMVDEVLPQNDNYVLKFTNTANSKDFKYSLALNDLHDGTATERVIMGHSYTNGIIYITDTDLPTITGPTADKALQPTDISYTVTDATTDVTEAWTIKNASGATIASGTKQADVKAAIAAIATAGEYTFEIVATDAAKNEAKGTTTFKFIPKTAGNEPVLNVTGTSKTVELGSAKPNLKTAFGVTATDKLGSAIADAQITATEIDSIPVDSSGNVTTEGTYKVKLEVTDPTTGLKANKEVTVTVVDTTAPVLTVTPTTINLNLEKGEANALTFDEFVEKHLTMTMVEAGSQTGIKLQSGDYSVDFANNGTNTFKVYVVDSAAAKNKSNEVSITVNVEMFDEIDDKINEAINAHDFNIKLSDVNDANLITGADAKAYDISVSPKNPVGLTVVSPLPTTVGDHTVKFETAAKTSKEVIAHVFDDIDPVNKEAINGHDFNIKLSDVNDENLIAGADAAAFDVTKNTPVSVAIATVTHSITSVGDYPVKFETAAGTSKEVTAHVYDEIDDNNKEAINAHDFVIQLSYVNEANVKQLSGLKAFDLSGNHAVQLNNDDINVSALPTTSGVHNIKFTTAKGSSITVKAHVFDIVDNVNKIAINANDFSMLIDDVNEAKFIANSGVEAFDVSDVNNITPITDIKVISKLPTTVGKHKVKFEATNAAGNTANIKVDASLFDHGTITPGQGSIFANNFDMKMKNMNNASVIAAAGVTAFDATGNAVDVKDIKLVSALPTTAGFHNFIFEANGVQVTVLGHVTARYQVVGHDLNMTMAEFKAFKANGTIEKEIIKRAEGKVINLDTGEIAELASVDYHTADITKLAPGKYDVVLNYTIDGDFIDEETPSTFGMNKTISKHVNLNITDDSNSGNGSNNGSNNGSSNGSQNGSGNGTNTDSNTSSLPSTGIAVDSTPVLLASGLVVLGFVLMLMNKKKKNEDQ